MATIRISMHRQPEIEVPAFLPCEGSHLAVHRPPPGMGKGWRISHLASGRSIFGDFIRRQDAVTIALQMLPTNGAWREVAEAIPDALLPIARAARDQALKMKRT